GRRMREKSGRGVGGTRGRGVLHLCAPVPGGHSGRLPRGTMHRWIGLLTVVAALSSACERREAPRMGAEGADSARPAAATVPADSAEWVLSADGYGPVRVGMTVADARAALGGLDAPPADRPECAYVA